MNALPGTSTEMTPIPLPERQNSFETELVRSLKIGQASAIAKLYKLYAPALLGIICEVIKNEDVAQDVLQESFLKIWRSIGQYDAAKGRLFTWMARLAKNTAIDQLRSRGELNSAKNENLQNLIIEIDQTHQILYNPEIIDIKALLSFLTPIQVKILNLVYFEGYTHIEAAEELELPIGTVKTRIRTAILTLRTFF